MTQKKDELLTTLEVQQSLLRDDIWRTVKYGLVLAGGSAVVGFATLGVIQSGIEGQLSPANIETWVDVFMEVAGVWSILLALKGGIVTAKMIDIGMKNIAETKSKLE